MLRYLIDVDMRKRERDFEEHHHAATLAALAGNKLFVYGTLQELHIQKRILGRELRGKPDALRGFAKGSLTINGEAFPVAIEQEGRVLSGQVLWIDPKKDWEKLRAYETEAYDAIPVVLESEEVAWTFLKSPDHRDS